jgi:thiol-disulfide isomerase/thioredoxin
MAAAVFGVSIISATLAESTTTSAPATVPATATAPATEPATKKARTPRAIMRELEGTQEEIAELIPSIADMLDEKVRAKTGEQAVPLLKKMVALIMEVGQADPRMTETADARAGMFRAFLGLFDDKETNDILAKQAGDADQKIAVRGKTTQQLITWWKNNKNEKAQEAVVDEMLKIAKENPKDDQIARTLMMMKGLGAATETVGDRAMDIIATTLTGEEALALKEQIGEMKKAQAAEEAAQKKLKEALNKPIELAAKTVDGKDFSTKEYKGKVVLVDFWATWCGPCVAELPHVKEIYKKYHEKGLEIVGISCDGSSEALKAFTKKEDMPWVQLWDVSQAEEGNQWHALATKWNVRGIPTMFLIDRSGNLRTVEARGKLEELIPKLLEEKEGEAKLDVKKEDAKLEEKKEETPK